jgi:hypothetical protein
LALIAGQVVNDHRGQDDVESPVLKRQRFGNRVGEFNLDAGLLRLLARSGDHLGRRVDPVNGARWADDSLGGNRERARPATHIQDGVTR